MSEAEYRESCTAQGERCYQEGHHSQLAEIPRLRAALEELNSESGIEVKIAHERDRANRAEAERDRAVAQVEAVRALCDEVTPNIYGGFLLRVTAVLAALPQSSLTVR